MWLLLLLPTALATDWSARWQDHGHLSIGEDAWLVDNAEIPEDLATWTLAEGYAFPVIAGQEDPRRVGFLYVGGGTLEIRFADPARAQAFANDAVMLMGLPVEELRPVVQGSPYRADLSDVLVLTADPMADALLSGMTPVRTQDRILLEAGEEEVVIVTDLEPLQRARREAERLLEVRTRHSREVGDDLRARVQSTLLQADLGDGATVVEVHTRTDKPFRRLLGFQDRTGSDDSWVTYLRDEAGAWDSASTAQVVVRGAQIELEREDFDEGLDRGGVEPADDERLPVPTFRTLAAVRAPADGPARRLEPVRGSAVVQASEVGAGNTVQIEVEAALTVRAVGGPFATLSLLVPRHDGRVWFGQPSLPSRWTLGRVTVDEAPAAVLVVDEADRRAERPGRRERAEVLIVPDAPIAEGEEATVSLEWSEEVRYAHVRAGDGGAMSHGTTTGLVDVLPVLAARPEASYPAVLSLGVPVEGAYEIALSGATVEEWKDRGREWRTSSTSSRAAALAVGRWPSRELSEAQMGFPRIRAQLFGGQEHAAKDVPIRVRQVLNFYRGMLPPFPLEEVDVVELPPDGDLDIAWANGFVGLQTALGGYEPTLRRDRPELEFVGLARALASQWWLDRDQHPSDVLVTDAITRSYAQLLLYAGWGADPPEAWRETWAECVREWDEHLPLSVVTGWSMLTRSRASDCAGPMVLGHQLRLQVGDVAWMTAMNAVLTGEHPADVAGLQAALEEHSEQDLDAYFAYWVVGGHVPELDLTYAVTPHGNRWKVVGLLESDVPFGTFEVPIVLERSAKVTQVEWVTVIDGVARFEVMSNVGKPRKVILNPDHHVLVRRQRVSKGKLEDVQASEE